MDIRSILDPLEVDDEVKAQAWDAYHASTSPEDFQRRFDPLPLPNEAKANLWDSRFAPKQAKVQGATPEDAKRELERYGLTAQPPQPPRFTMKSFGLDRGSIIPKVKKTEVEVTSPNLQGLTRPPRKMAKEDVERELDRMTAPPPPAPLIYPKTEPEDYGLVRPRPAPIAQDANAALQGTGLETRPPRPPALPRVDDRPFLDRPIPDLRKIPGFEKALEGKIGSPQSAGRIASVGAASAAEAAAGIVTPRNIGIAAGMLAANVAGTALSPFTGGSSAAIVGLLNVAATTYFTSEMLMSIVRAAPEAHQALEEGDYETAARIIGPAAVEAVLARGLVKHVGKPSAEAVISYRRARDLYRTQQRHLGEAEAAKTPFERETALVKARSIGEAMDKLPTPSLLPPIPSPSGVTAYVKQRHQLGPAADVLPDRLYSLTPHQRRLVEQLGEQQANLLGSRITEPERPTPKQEMNRAAEPLQPADPPPSPPAQSAQTSPTLLERLRSERGSSVPLPSFLKPKPEPASTQRPSKESGILKIGEIIQIAKEAESKPEAAKAIVSSLIDNFAKSSEREIVDRYADIRRFTAPAKLAREADPYVGSRMFAGRAGKIEALLRGKGGPEKSLQEIVRPAYKKGYLKDMTEYALLERYEELHGRGIAELPGGMTIDQARTRMMEMEQTLGPERMKEIRSSIEELRAYSDRILKASRDAGLISAEGYERIKAANQKYVPLQRLDFVHDKLDAMSPGSTIFSVSGQDLVMALKGSKREVLDPIQGIIRNTYKAVALIERNKVARQMADLANHPAFEGQVFELKHYKNGWQTPPAGFDFFNVMIDGKVRRFAAPEHVVQAMKGMTEREADLATRLMSKSSSWLRAGATTFNAAFIPSNAIRDYQTARIVSEVGFRWHDWMRGFAEAIRKGPDYQRYLESGGAFSGMFEMYKSMPHEVKSLTGQMTLDKALNVVNPFSLIRLAGEKIEMAPRLGVFKRAIRQGKTDYAAGFASRNATVDFAKAGSFIKMANLWVPFLNARLQGTLNIAGALKHHPARAAWTVATMIGIPTVYTYYHNSRLYPEIWNNIRDFEKQNNFILIYGDQLDEDGNPIDVLKIPKGDAKFFGNPIEHFLGYLDDANQASAKRLALEWLSDAFPFSFVRDGEPDLMMFLSSVTPPAPKAAAEWAFNKNFYTGLDIVPRKGRLQEASPTNQYKFDTPKSSVAIAKFLGVSPLKLQNTIGTQFGGLGRQLISAADMMGTWFGAWEDSQAKGPLSQVTGRFVGAKGGGVEEREFEHLREADQRAADEYAVSHRAATGLHHSLKKASPEQRIEIFKDFLRAEKEKLERIDDPVARMEAERITAGTVRVLAERISAEAQGLTDYEMALKQRPVVVRANEVLRQMKQLTPEKKSIVFERWVNKGIITKDVAREILKRAKAEAAKQIQEPPPIPSSAAVTGPPIEPNIPVPDAPPLQYQAAPSAVPYLSAPPPAYFASTPTPPAMQTPLPGALPMQYQTSPPAELSTAKLDAPPPTSPTGLFAPPPIAPEMQLPAAPPMQYQMPTPTFAASPFVNIPPGVSPGLTAAQPPMLASLAPPERPQTAPPEAPPAAQLTTQPGRSAALQQSAQLAMTRPLEWAESGVVKFSMRENLRRGGMDLVNRTFPGRLNDHIQFLKDLGMDNRPVRMFDIGPGVGDFQHPAITTREMAEAFPNMKVVALDIPESVSTLADLRRKNPKFGSELLSRPNINVLAGDGLKSLAQQAASGTDAFTGRPIEPVRPDETVVIRAVNSIDIYYQWPQIKAALEQMGRDFVDNPAILFYSDKILAKQPGSTEWTAIGNVSPRGFNHRMQTTRHVPDSTPPYTLLRDPREVLRPRADLAMR